MQWGIWSHIPYLWLCQQKYHQQIVGNLIDFEGGACYKILAERPLADYWVSWMKKFSPIDQGLALSLSNWAYAQSRKEGALTKRWLRNGIQQFRGSLGQSVSKFHDTDDSDVLLTPLDRTDVVAV